LYKKWGTLIPKFNFLRYPYIYIKNKKKKSNKSIIFSLRLLIINNLILQFKNRNLFKKFISNNIIIIDKVLNNFYKSINILNHYFIDYIALTNDFNQERDKGIGGYGSTESNLILNNKDSSYLLSKEFVHNIDEDSDDEDGEDGYIYNNEKINKKNKKYILSEIGPYMNYYNIDRKILNKDLLKSSENLLDYKFYRLLSLDNNLIFNNKEIINKAYIYYSYFDWLYYDKSDLLSTNKYYFFNKRINKVEYNIYIKPKILKFLKLMEEL
jgi:hypothetical protein